MKTAQCLQEIVEMSAQRFDLDLNTPNAYLRIEDSWEKSITIHRIDTNLLTVGEYSSVVGREPVGSPEFTLFTGADEWLPVGHESSEKGFRYGASLYTLASQRRNKPRASFHPAIPQLRNCGLSHPPTDGTYLKKSRTRVIEPAPCNVRG